MLYYRYYIARYSSHPLGVTEACHWSLALDFVDKRSERERRVHLIESAKSTLAVLLNAIVTAVHAVVEPTGQAVDVQFEDDGKVLTNLTEAKHGLRLRRYAPSQPRSDFVFL